MGSRYRYFFLGVLFTSITWVTVIILYSNVVEIGQPRKGLGDRPRFEHNSAALVIHADFDNEVGQDFEKARDDFDLFDHHKKQAGNSLADQEKTTKSSWRLAAEELDEIGKIHTADDQKIREAGYKNHAFNQLISDRIGNHRTIPDTRNSLCKDLMYKVESLPVTSVVVCFYNEALSTLLRTVYSVLDRTPRRLLHEIILVDDASDLPDLAEDVERRVRDDELARVPVRLVRNDKRQGLMRARVIGAKQATGEVLMFLDSHCEVNADWLQPLVERIARNRSTVVCPIIDIISSDTFQYTASPQVRGGFNWGLHFKWDSVPRQLLQTREDFIKPYRSPTMAGGLFAINRAYFSQIGLYDTGMDIWGGENLELSFRVWQCGGVLEIVPCSRVGHIFRKRRPYGAPNGEDTMGKNSLRLAHVWMDEYKENFFEQRPDLRNRSYGDVSERVALRQKLHCKSFKWYLDTVYPEQRMPGQSAANVNNLRIGDGKRRRPQFIRHFAIRHQSSKLCVEPNKEINTKGSLLVLAKCVSSFKKRQVWSETEVHELMLAERLCMDAERDAPRIMKCHSSGGAQQWKLQGPHNEAKLYNVAAGKCLSVSTPKSGALLEMAICKAAADKQQVWELVHISDPSRHH